MQPGIHCWDAVSGCELIDSCKATQPLPQGTNGGKELLVAYLMQQQPYVLGRLQVGL
jgi:hypothetical protein